jgi:hypothetical protein
VIILAFIKVWPIIRQQNIDFTAAARKAYEDRIVAAEAKTQRACDRLAECERLCDEREEAFKNTIDELKTQINNEAWNRVQSEISLVNTLIAIVDAPQLRVILEALQRRSNSLPAAITMIGGPVSDAGPTGNGNGDK